MDKTLKWFTYCWVALVLVLNIVSVIGLFIGAPTFWAGWQKVQHMYSPLNVVNFITEVVLLSPAIGAECWRRKRRAARKVQEQEID